MDMKLLIVDDNSEFREAIGELLSLGGYESNTCVESATIALDLLKTTSFDLILSDLLMPKMNGMEFYAEVQKLENPPPFVLITGSDLEDVNDVLDARIPLLHKPFGFKQLNSLILQVLHESAPERPKELEPTALEL